MENTTDNQFTNDIAAQPERPQFLKVLCILTWVCCGLIFISSVFKLISQTPEKQQEKIEKMRALNPEMADQLEAVVAAQDPAMQMMNTVLTLIAVLMSAYGAILMWQLKKTGFFVYLGGEILPYFGFVLGGAQAIAAVSGMAGGLGAAVAGAAIGMMVICDLAFIIMYAVNLKYLKK